MKRKLFYLHICVLLIAISSCKKVLNQEPKNSTYLGEFWQSAKDVKGALAGNYSLLRDAITSGNFNGVPRYFVYGDGVEGNYFTIQYNGDGLEGVQTGDFTGQYNIESYGDWTKYYKTIAMSNLIIKRVAAMTNTQLADDSNPDQLRNEALGQAYFIRALTYFMLTRTWGNVPLVVEAYDDPINAPQLPSSPKSTILAQVESDCKMAVSLLPWIYRDLTQAKVTANKGSVYALMAHMYLWRATTTDLNTSQPIMSDVENAQTSITALKSGGGYNKVDTTNYYSTFVGKSAEGIFEIAASEENLEGSNRHIATFFLRTKYISYNSDNSRFYVPPTYLSTHFKKFKTGQVASVWHEGEWVWNVSTSAWVWVDGHFEDEDVLADRITDVRYVKNFTDLSTDRPTCIKYHNVNYRNTNSAYVSNNIIVFRYSDMLLLEAEIAIYKNNLSSAIEVINSFRKSNDPNSVNGGLIESGASKATVLHEYMIERGRELYLEGQNYYDLIRTRQYADFITWLSESRFKQGGFYWPVATELFKNNPNLQQTPYWIGKV